MFNFNFNRPAELFDRANMNADSNPMAMGMAGEFLNEKDDRENIKVFDPKKFMRNQMVSAGVTGLERLSNLSGNTYQNALLRFNAQQTPRLNKDQYSTNQDLYGTNYAKQGGLKQYDNGGNYQNLVDEYNFLAQDNPEDADFFQAQAAQYQQQFMEFQQKQFQNNMFATLEDHAASIINPQQEDIQSYTPQPWSTTLNSEFLTQDENTNSEGYAPTSAPSINIGFNPKPTTPLAFTPTPVPTLPKGKVLGKGLDVSGDRTKMDALFTYAQQKYGKGNHINGIDEMAWNPRGVYNNGIYNPKGKWANHDNHIHFGFTDPNIAMDIIAQGKKLGLRTSENPFTTGVHPVHAKGSFHYQHFKLGGSPKIKPNRFK